MNDLRVNAKDVRLAYEATDTRPITGRMYLARRDDNGLETHCACAMGVLFRAETGFYCSAGHDAYEWARDKYGADYRDGFVLGFDAEPHYKHMLAPERSRASDAETVQERHGSRGLEGYQDGCAAAREVLS